MVRDHEALGSSPSAPTSKKSSIFIDDFCYALWCCKKLIVAVPIIQLEREVRVLGTHNVDLFALF